MYLRPSNSLHSILASVLCKKNEAILTQIPCFWAALNVFLIRVEPRGMVQPITHNLVETETRWQRPYHLISFSQSQ